MDLFHPGPATTGTSTDAPRLRRALLITAIAVSTMAVASPAAPAHADTNEATPGNVPAQSISAGSGHSCAVLDNGRVTCWGRNTSGQLGYGDTNNRGDAPGEMGIALPTVDLGTGRTARTVAAGGSHTCALLDTAQVKCWGEGISGQLGYGTTNNRGDAPGEMGDNLPTVDLGTGRTARALTAGNNHTCALLDTAQVKCWGSSSRGQLGQGDTATRGDGPGEMGDNLPAIDLGTGRTARAVSAGFSHTCALLDTAQVKCWGIGFNGRLGEGGTNDRGDEPGEMGDALATVALGTGRSVTAISSGATHTCVILDTAQLKCWGSGSGGRLGYGDADNRGDGPGEMGDALPVVDVGSGRTVRAVTAAFSHTCALLDTAQVKCWGFSANGQLGYGNSTARGDQLGEMGDALPALEFGTGRTVTAVTAGDDHTCALLDTAQLKCWGYSGDGQLGVGSNVSDRGDQPGEMGDNLPVVDLTRTIGRAGLEISLTADRRVVIAGATIAYTVSIRNVGTSTLTAIDVHAPDAPLCARDVPVLAPQATASYTCTLATTADDVPQVSNQVFARSLQGVGRESPRVRTRVEARVLRPDGQIRTGAGAFLGSNIYNTTGTGQSATATTATAVNYTWRIQNDGNVTDRFRLTGNGGNRRFAVVYRSGTTNITTAVRAGTFTTASLAPGASTDITVTITPTRRARAGNALTATLTARSAASSSVIDTVRATATRR